MEQRENLFSRFFDTDSSTSGIQQDLSTTLEKNMTAEICTWWDRRTLQRYVDKSIIPRGLRLKKIPTHIYSEEFLCKWNSMLTDCSINLMKLIIEEENIKLEALNKDIENNKTAIRQNMQEQQFTDLLSNIQDKVNKYQQDIAAIKAKKFQRDIEDYKNGSIYTWKRTGRSISRSRDHSSQRKKTVSFSDESGNGFTSNSDMEQTPSTSYATSKNYKKRGYTELGENIGKRTRGRQKKRIHWLPIIRFQLVQFVKLHAYIFNG